MPRVLHIGDIVELKKTHPCGSKQWEIIRVGADIKIRCCECKRIVMIDRVRFEKDVKKVIFENLAEENEKSE